MNVSDRPPAAEQSPHISRGPASHAEPRPPRRRVFLLVAVVVLGLLAWGAYGHWKREQAATNTQSETVNFTPTVRVTTVKALAGPVDLTLPGNTLAFEAARLFARATGYVAERHVDIGSRVQKGDLLARIAAPELDQQLAQAQAQLMQLQAALLQAQANVEEAKSN